MAGTAHQLSCRGTSSFWRHRDQLFSSWLQRQPCSVQLSSPKLREQEFATWIFLPWILLLILGHNHPSSAPIFGRWRREKGIQHWKWSSSRSNTCSWSCSSLKAGICKRKTWWINTIKTSIYGLVGFIQQTPFGLGYKAWYLQKISHSTFWMSPSFSTWCEDLLHPSAPDVLWDEGCIKRVAKSCIKSK